MTVCPDARTSVRRGSITTLPSRLAGVAIALMRNRFSPDFTAIARLDDIVAEAYPPSANPEEGSPS
jgi:hypothetical protein